MIPSSGFDLVRVRNEFAGPLTPDNLVSMFNRVDLLSGSNDRLTNFGGTGQPECSVMTPTVTGQSVSFRGNLSNIGGARTWYYWQIRQGTGSWETPDFGAGGATVSTTTSGTKTRSTSVAPGTYQCRFMAYNGFNDSGSLGSSYHTNGGTTTFTVSPPSMADIIVGAVSPISGQGYYQYSLSWTQGTPRATSVLFASRLGGMGSYINCGLAPGSPAYNPNSNSNTMHIEINHTAPLEGQNIDIQITGIHPNYGPVYANWIYWRF